MEIQKHNKSQRSFTQCSHSMQDILLLPSINPEEPEFYSKINKLRAESFESLVNPSPTLKNSPKEKLLDKKPFGQKKIHYLTPLERPKTTFIGEKATEKTKEIDKKPKGKTILKEFIMKNQLDEFRNEISSKFEEIVIKLEKIETKVLQNETKTAILEEKLARIENSSDLNKLEESFNYKYSKIKEYFSKFGDQFKTHLRLYDKKKKETDKSLQIMENYVKNGLESGLRAKFEVFEAEKREEFKNMFDKIKDLKEEINIHSIVHSEFQGMFELQGMVQNDFKSELKSLVNELNGKIDLQLVFQRELENEMKIMNETQGDLFKGVKKNQLELDSLNKILQNLSANYNIFKKVQEKETVIKNQLIDLLGDINHLKNKMNSDGELEKSLKKGQMEEIYKLIDQKFDVLKENTKNDN